MLSICCIITGLSALAAPTALNFIPVADVMEPDTFRLEYLNNGSNSLFSNGCQNYLLLEAGVTARMELGVDFCAEDQDATAFNAKYLLAPETDKSPALSIGTQNVGNNLTSQYYLTSAKTFGRQRFFAGVISDTHKTDPMLGYEYDLSDDTCLLLDWTSGDDNFMAVGACYQLKSGPAIAAVYGIPNASGGEKTVYVDLSWEWSFSHNDK